MAVVESILLNKAKGSIGDVTFYELKGQVIARERNRSPYDPKTAAQLAQRAKMKNYVYLWQAFQYFLEFIKPLRLEKQSIYNWFCSQCLPLITNQVDATYTQIMQSLSDNTFGVTNTAYLTGLTAFEDRQEVYFNTAGYDWVEGMRARTCVWNEADNSFYYQTVTITQDIWNQGYYVTNLGTPTNYHYSCYMYNVQADLCSNVGIL